MGEPVVHFEIIGTNPEGLRRYYGELFGWEFDTSSPVSAAVSEPTNYGFVEPAIDGIGIPGGVGGGAAYRSQAIFMSAFPTSRPRCRRQRASAELASWAPSRPPRDSSSAISPILRAT